MSSRFSRVSRRIGVRVGTVLVYILIWLGLVLLITGIGIRLMWGPISVGQMMLNLVNVQVDGGGGSLVWVGILAIVVAPIVLTLIIALVHYLLVRKRRRLEREGRAPEPKRPAWIKRSVATVLVLGLTVGGGAAFASTVGVADYIKSASSNYNMGDYYAEPQVIGNAHKNNIVTIYLESGEGTLTNTDMFEKNPYQSLEDATPESEGWKSIDNYQQYEGGGWTMAGLTSTQCGIPLKSPGLTETQNSIGKSKSGDEGYLAGAACAGDVFKEQGYKSEFLGGANKFFASKDKLLSNHGYDEEKDLNTWRQMGEDPKNFRSDWGLSDQRLMAHAKDEVDALHSNAEKTGQPFNLSMLTLDTHEPTHVYDYCNVDTDDDLISVFACSMDQVAGLVNHMKEKGYLKDTAVVIQGDHFKHLGAGDAYHEQLDNNPDRWIFNRVWVPESNENSRRELRDGVDQLNMYPTILNAAGLDIKNGQAGLGVSAFMDGGEIPQDSAQALKPGQYKDLLDSLSKEFYEKMWGDKTSGKDENEGPVNKQ